MDFTHLKYKGKTENHLDWSCYIPVVVEGECSEILLCPYYRKKFLFL